MKSIGSKVYVIKIILYIIQFYFVLMMLHNILDAGVYGIIFMIFYILFALKIIYELLSKKTKYKSDFVYNAMQAGIFGYLLIIAIKTTLANIFVTKMTFGYFKINYIILSILILFVFIYDILENNERKNVKRQ